MSLRGKLAEAIRNPKLVFYYLKRKKYAWTTDSNGFSRKIYDSYQQYLQHQKEKLQKIEDGTYAFFKDKNYDTEYANALRKRLEDSGRIKAGSTVLCLAARLGTEVKAFLGLNCFAVGLDLNPGKENKYVVYGDFHEIQFPDGSVDVVFCNSLDHAFELNKLLSEIKRVLRPNGQLVLEINLSADEAKGSQGGYFEALSWDSNETLMRFLESQGFRCVQSTEIDFPWKGLHAYFSPC
jgi:SAM-dependent methyltransferase